jgi:hypothetical protein
MMGKILLTEASGYIGSHLKDKLKVNHEIYPEASVSKILPIILSLFLYYLRETFYHLLFDIKVISNNK